MSKISDLPPADPLDGTETIPLVQDGETKRANLAEYIGDKLFAVEDLLTDFQNIAADVVSEFSESLSDPIDQRVGSDTVPALDLSTPANRTVRCSEAITVASEVHEFGIWARNNGTVKVKAHNSSDVVVAEASVAVIGGQLNIFDNTDIGVTFPAGGFLALYSNDDVLTYSSSGSSPAWGIVTGDYASGGGFTGTIRVKAYAIMRHYVRYVDADLIHDLEETVETDQLGKAHLTDDVVETLGSRAPLVTHTTGLGANTFVLKEAVTAYEELALIEIFARIDTTVKIKAFSGNETDGFVLEDESDAVAITAGYNALEPADFGSLVLRDGEYPAIYNTPAAGVAYKTGVSTPSWILNGDSSGGVPFSSLDSQIMVRYHFKRKRNARVLERRDYDYDVITGSQLMVNTALPGVGGIDYLVLGLGQSLSIGSNSTGADLALTTSAEHPGYGLMANCGVRPEGAAITSFVDLVETDDSNSHETPAAGCISAIIDRLYARHGRKPRVIYAIAGEGGRAYAAGPGTAGEDLKRGSITYAEGLRVVRECTAVSIALGRQLIVIAATLCHGEQDNTFGTERRLYQRALDQWQSNMEEDVKRITGQTDPLPFYIYQTCRAAPGTGNLVGYPAQSALAQLDAPQRNPKIRGVGPMYYCPQAADFDHVTSRGYRWIGRQMGTFIAEDLFGPYYEPMRVVETYWSSTSKFCLRFNKAISIETDDSKVVISTLGAGKGVDFDDGSGAAPAITGIAVKAGTTDTVEVTLASAPTGLRKRAWVAARRNGGNGSGNVTGNRSGIRSTGTFDVDPQDSSNLYHWAAQQELIL